MKKINRVLVFILVGISATTMPELAAGGTNQPIVVTIDGIDKQMTAGGLGGILPGKTEGRGDGYLREPVLSHWGFVTQKNLHYIPWSGDSLNTDDEIGKIKDQLERLVKLSLQRGQPLIIVGHSWGTVLAYRALSELGKEGRMPANSVSQLVMMGSPINSQNDIYRGESAEYMDWQGTDSLDDYVQSWSNYWIKKDKVSGEIVGLENDTELSYKFFSRILFCSYY